VKEAAHARPPSLFVLPEIAALRKLNYNYSGRPATCGGPLYWSIWIVQPQAAQSTYSNNTCEAFLFEFIAR
jgi:hypothetical protein